MVTVQAENKKLAEPLRKAKEELHRLKGKIDKTPDRGYFLFLLTGRLLYTITLVFP